MSTAIEKYKELQARVEALRKEAQKEMQAAFNEGAKELFQECPLLLAFGWAQYTPYFNDGDECVFGVNSDYPGILLSDDSKKRTVVEFNSAPLSSFELDYKDEDPLHQRTEEAVTRFLQTFADEDMKNIFGDHVQVRICRDLPPNVTDYSHD